MNQKFVETSQAIAEATHDIATPSNGLSLAGFGFVMHGASRLNTWSGLIETGAGFVADIYDGKLARATGTNSDLGEKVDASLDKIKTGYFATRLLVENKAPRHLIYSIIGQNVINAGITLYDQKKNPIQNVHPIKAGKYGMFAQNAGLGLHAVGSKLAETHPKYGRATKILGTTVAYSGVTLSLLASKEYARQAHLI